MFSLWQVGHYRGLREVALHGTSCKIALWKEGVREGGREGGGEGGGSQLLSLIDPCILRMLRR